MAKLSDLQKLLKGLDDKIEHLQATKRLILDQIDSDSKHPTAKPKRTPKPRPIASASAQG